MPGLIQSRQSRLLFSEPYNQMILNWTWLEQIRQMKIHCSRITLALSLCLLRPTAKADTTLLNVSYDPTRELYQDFNAAFAKHWQAKTGEKVTIRQSHGGSGAQARSVIDGSTPTSSPCPRLRHRCHRDKGEASSENWQTRLPHNSSPYTSTIVFLVRKGNPKGVKIGTIW
jgi:sulfate transport system substrate-binding protein